MTDIQDKMKFSENKFQWHFNTTRNIFHVSLKIQETHEFDCEEHEAKVHWHRESSRARLLKIESCETSEKAREIIPSWQVESR